MRQLTELINFWQDRAGESLVLCTLVRKEGSSYCAPGAKKIVAIETSDSCGLLSGGCLESDIEQSAREGWDALPFLKTFSTLSETDRLLGYQTGCAGLITILFEKLPGSPPDHGFFIPYGPDQQHNGVAIDLGDNIGQRRWATESTVAKDAFFDPWISPIELTVIGCGSDAPAFADLARPLGWQLSFVDYRSDHQPAGLNVKILPLADVATSIRQGPNSAVILVTHNYEADMEILAGLNGKDIGYLGCLGPAKRYHQMKQDLQQLHGLTIDAEWEKIVHAPAGLLPKQRTPETIALSVIAEIQQVLNG